MARGTDDGISARIMRHYNVKKPDFAYCLGGLRRLSVDPDDRRARKMLLARGIRHLSRNQFFVHLVRSRLPVDLFLDIGTNYGECLVAAPPYCKVRTRGFEANPRLVRHLRRTLAMNDDLAAIELVYKAVTERPGQKLDFFVSRQWSGKSSLVAGVDTAAERIEVVTTSIDAELAHEPDIDLLFVKVDVEGNEERVIEGAGTTFDRVPNVIVLMEFDAQFLARAGTDPAAFFARLRTRFDAYLPHETELLPLADFAAFEAALAGKPQFHDDLLLTRFANPALAARFAETMAPAGLAKARRQIGA